MKHSLIVILGPTAVGKTDLAITLAKAYRTEILSADSRQIYKELDIGVAKPTKDQLKTVKHHFINYKSIREDYNAGRFEADALTSLKEIYKKYPVAIMVGGSGLYIKAVCEGFDELPKSDASVRKKLNQIFEKKGIEPLQEALKKADPEYYKKVDRNNPQRLIRALEVYESSGAPFSSFHQRQKKKRDFEIIKIGLEIPRKELYDRINQRVDDMMAKGLLEEVKSLMKYKHLNSLQTVGYQELFNYLDGKTDLETAINLIKQNTRRYAKRQMTWFRKDKEIEWFEAEDVEDIRKYLALHRES